MCHLKHRLRTFLFRRNIMFHSQDIQVFVFLNIPWFTKSVSQDAFLNYLWNHNSWSYQTWSVDRYKELQYFSVIFWTIWRTGTRFLVLFNLTTCPNYSITIHVKIPVFHFFEKVNKGQLKMVYFNHWKWPDLALLSF